ncbi:AMP-dependent synthetase/ligase [Parasphaerochaeta coccoides]|uniref:Long-chain-fatty-acid--CoA ligase n=1 Tax=Parasphaerochaeta coccoides (strain ATCC BAA-1237 / DSM 17374 / SPN1) TaxID=760011 RepID=F4GH32_PARC1|nr:AMP-binding protein [Parasphaerochaeta coccoides]AEC01507.1 Long-chain-fatty-acid--CoA ligase [Parasphaerochaeta coccoides DSM 17374]
MERTVISLLHEAAQRYGSRPYTTKKTDGGWFPYSFVTTDQETDYLAAALHVRFPHPETTYALLSEGRPEWVNFEFGAVKARGISVPLSIKLTPEEIAFRVNHSEAAGIACSHNTLANVVKAAPYFENKNLLFIYLDETDENLSTHMTGIGRKEGEGYITYSRLVEEGRKLLADDEGIVRRLETQIKENDTINICYTSGTTGNPKGIMLTHLNYWANSKDCIDLFKIPHATFETLVVLPSDHSFAHTVGIYAGVRQGITLHFVDARGSNAAIIRNFPKNLPEVNPIFLMSVPSITGNFMRKIRQNISSKGKFIEGIFERGIAAGIVRNGDGFHRARGWSRVKTWFPYTLANILVFSKIRSIFGNRFRFFVGGGALLEAKQQHFFAALAAPVYQGYGLTEAAPVICSNTPQRVKFGTSGMVAPSVTCKIMKEADTEAKIGEKGEIVIKGDNVMKGYFKNPEASAEALRDGWLWTGDLGYYDEDGFLVVTGREKALLISKDGEKYSPEEVEEVMVNNIDVLNQLMVYNDHQVLTTALVTLQDDVAKALLKAEGADTAEAALEVLEKALRSYEPKATAIPNVWLPDRFIIIPDAFSEADGLVNSTMKLVRYKTIEFYKDRIAAAYESVEENKKHNLEAVRRQFFS